MNIAQKLLCLEVIYLLTIGFLPIFFPIMYVKPFELLILPEFQSSRVIYLLTIGFLPIFFPIMYVKPFEILILPEFQATDILLFTPFCAEK